MNSKIEEINPEAYYSMTMIMKRKWFPWIKSKSTFRNMLRDEETAQTVYKAIIRKVGNQDRYLIKGENIINIINLANEGKLKI